ncbi:MAG: methyltransferase domain-containing protein [Phycisphaerales bacterium]|nr:MAG: methyltransferase domain-containing protein [Phycisphaerales bacterium]
MQPELTSTVAPPAKPTRTELLRRFLEAYWLRPENAFWMTLRSMALGQVPLAGPAADLCCGDGVFTFLHTGGVFDPAFDVFSAVDHLDDVRDQHSDMFDCVNDAYHPPIVVRPESRIAAGTDHKAALLAKAQRLDLYDRLVEHDANTTLPFEEDSFETVYCNAAYWVSDIDGFLKEMARITRPTGRVVLQVKLDSLKGYTLESHRDSLGDRFLDIIGRGRAESWPSLADRATWESRFVAAGLSVEEATPFITRTHAHIWDIGLRPIAPILVRMANNLSPQTRTETKRDWVDLFRELLDPITDPGVDLFPRTEEPGEIQYVLALR